MKETMPVFAPHLFIKSGLRDVTFYSKAFGAEEIRRWSNDDGTIHVVEFSINGSLFHLHEEKPSAGSFSPEEHHGITSSIGLFVTDVDVVMKNAIAAGAEEISPAEDYDYGYRQGEVKDPFGHRWLIEKKS